MRNVISFIRKILNVKAVAYLDDIVLLHQDKQEQKRIAQEVISIFQKIGHIVNLEKSLMKPSNRFSFLGYSWDTSNFTATLEKDRKKELLTECYRWRRRALKCEQTRVRDFASYIGKLSATRFVFKEASLLLPSICMLLNRMVRKMGWKGKMRINPSILPSIQKWISRLNANKPRQLCSLFQQQATLTTDASERELCELFFK
ncbi:uncharacterized protein MONOS_4558 [Monocercomonoides exilis]|uniref:uncharacterized protein n=1 Tax=Monocercomonoides exilis TaxID=2049356 RepID=UPI00355A8AD3|nr:hypothetical protein MONOS_4558 [Monocercomonoides exilis]|eukprot:MONOS_4558.1-p1 / transcript=MONOS_4558.1 / gene=MONOS_4558 / organism=Monocercomonoides_exilis_PA203 / gene_product=unspecified product / transcript_product=unspecified product / location=Mono_scaffold00122:69106-69711(-) / protein_length=201 / sequence_SO=supercontig / SO=protein_coding / is_pseudo=false